MNAEELNRVSGGDWSALDELLARLEAELRASRAMPIRRLRRKEVLDAPMIAWSYTSAPGKDLNTRAAEQFLWERLAGIGLGLFWSPVHTSDDDGSVLTAWRIGHARFAETPTRFIQQIRQLEDLDPDTQEKKAKRLARRRKFDLLAAWLCEARYSGTPASVLRHSRHKSAAALVIGLLDSSYPDIRIRAATALGPLGGEDAVQALYHVLPRVTDPETDWIVYALDRLGSASAIEPLTQALQTASNPHRRVQLAKALARCGGEHGLDALIAGVKQRDEPVAEYVAALVDLDTPRAVPVLERYLESLQMTGAREDAGLVAFLTWHGKPPVSTLDTVLRELPTGAGFIATEAAWSIQPAVLQLKEAIRKTWGVTFTAFELTDQQAAVISRHSPMTPKQWVVNGQYQIELGDNSIFVHAYGAYFNAGSIMFDYQGSIYYVNVEPSVRLTGYLYDRTDDLSQMAKIAIALAGHIRGHQRATLLIQLDGDLKQPKSL